MRLDYDTRLEIYLENKLKGKKVGFLAKEHGVSVQTVYQIIQQGNNFSYDVFNENIEKKYPIDLQHSAIKRVLIDDISFKEAALEFSIHSTSL